MSLTVPPRSLLGLSDGSAALKDSVLVPYQATFALFTTSRRRSSAACLFRQMM